MADLPLNRVIRLPLLTLYGLGTMVGAGIYVIIGKVAGHAGMYTPIAFVVAAVIAGFTACSYAELCARHPLSGGEAVYMQQAFGKRVLSAITGWLVVVTGVISAGLIAKGFAGYLTVFVDIPEYAAILAFVGGLGIIAIMGISHSLWFAAIVTLASLAGLAIVIFDAGNVLQSLPHRWPDALPPLSISVWIGIAAGSFLAFYSYIGFEDMVNIAEEVRAPMHTMPRGIILALVLATLVYILVALVAVLAVPPLELANSVAPLVTVVEQKGSLSPDIVAAMGLLAVTNSALAQIIMASRVMYGLAYQRAAPQIMRMLHPTTRTPVPGTAIVVVVSASMAILLPLQRLAELTSLIVLVVFAAMNIALIKLKKERKTRKGIFSTPIWVPWTGFVLSVALILVQIVPFVLPG